MLFLEIGRNSRKRGRRIPWSIFSVKFNKRKKKTDRQSEKFNTKEIDYGLWKFNWFNREYTGYKT